MSSSSPATAVTIFGSMADKAKKTARDLEVKMAEPATPQTDPPSVTSETTPMTRLRPDGGDSLRRKPTACNGDEHGGEYGDDNGD